MKPELQNTRTTEQLAEIFRQLAGEPMTSLLTAPVLKYAGLRSTGETMDDLLCMCDFADGPFGQGTESVMFAGDLACLVETIVDKLRKNEYGSRSAKPRQIIERLLDVFIVWASCSDTQKKG